MIQKKNREAYCHHSTGIIPSYALLSPPNEKYPYPLGLNLETFLLPPTCTLSTNIGISHIEFWWWRMSAACYVLLLCRVDIIITFILE